MGKVVSTAFPVCQSHGTDGQLGRVGIHLDALGALVNGKIPQTAGGHFRTDEVRNASFDREWEACGTGGANLRIGLTTRFMLGVGATRGAHRRTALTRNLDE